MKKFFLFAAAIATAMTINAQAEYGQLVTFGDTAVAKGPWSNGYVWEGELIDVTIFDENEKAEIDLNQAYFGNAEAYTAYESRLKSGGKTDTKGLHIEVDAWEKGTLYIMVRTGSNSATDRNLVVSQNNQELFNQVIEEANAIEVEMDCETCEGGKQMKKVYPVIALDVEKGNINVSFPTGALNFYAFAFDAEGDQAVNNVEATVKAVKTFENGQLVIVKNGVKYNALGAKL